MRHVVRTIEVGVPVGTAYRQWMAFEDFPLFMQGVREVRLLEQDRFYWRASLGGHFEDVEWVAEVTVQEPERRISWRSIEGVVNAGTVAFGSLGPEKTRIELKVDYQPQGVGQLAGAAIGVVDNRIESDLEQFKIFVEGRWNPVRNNPVHPDEKHVGLDEQLRADA